MSWRAVAWRADRGGPRVLGAPAVTAELLRVGGGVVRVTRIQTRIDDPDGATAKTVAAMVDLIWDSARDPLVRHYAGVVRDRWAGAGLGAWRSDEDLAAGAWWWVKHHLEFLHDDTLLLRLLNEGLQLEALTAPAVVAQSFIREGDCDDFTMLVCCLLSVLGVPWEIVTVAADPREPGRFSHVYARAVLPDGGRLPLDASHGHYPGWEVPKGDVMRVRVWDDAGRPVPGAGLGELRGYQRAAPRRLWPAVLRRRGLGDCYLGVDDVTGETCGQAAVPEVPVVPVVPVPPAPGGPGSGTTVLSNPWWQTPTPATPAGGASVGTPAATPGGSGWDKTLQNLLQSWTAIGSKVIAPTTTITTKTGSVSIPGSQPGAIFGTSILGTGTMSTTTLLILGGLGLAAILAFSRK